MVSFSQIFFLPVRDNGEALLWCGHTVRKVLLDFAVWDRRRYCKALCDVKFSQIHRGKWSKIWSHTAKQ